MSSRSPRNRKSKEEQEAIKREAQEIGRRAKEEARQLARDLARSAKGEAQQIAQRAREDARKLHAEPETIWARPQPGERKPRFTRDQLARTALEIADADGFEAVSMRRLAAELGAGTMTLYHYVRTKDELKMLMDDAVMGEVLIPEGELASDWRGAMTQIATSSRNAFKRHPWAFEALKGSGFGPNGMMHFEQSMEAVKELDWPFAEKLELITLVDDYVFGFTIRSQEYFVKDLPEEEHARETLSFMDEQLKTGDYPEVARMLEGIDLDSAWGPDGEVAKLFMGNRFERGLEILLDGIELDIKRRKKKKK
jgi:AcrR family transcriptional regulator